MALGHSGPLGRALLGGTLLTGTLLAGCSRPPTLSESARRLNADTRSVFTESARRLSEPGATPTTLADTTVPCADGLRRKVYRGRLPLRRGASTSVTLDHAATVTLELIRERGYRLEQPPSPRRRTFTMARDVPEVRLTVRLGGGRQPVLVLEGSTPCLPE
ncbi:MAG: hypothetical protein ACRDOO_02580 [Actinomadura sp.]